MYKIPQQAFFQVKSSKGQQVHRKIVNITIDQGTANQNHKDIVPHAH